MLFRVILGDSSFDTLETAVKKIISLFWSFPHHTVFIVAKMTSSRDERREVQQVHTVMEGSTSPDIIYLRRLYDYRFKILRMLLMSTNISKTHTKKVKQK